MGHYQMFRTNSYCVGCRLYSGTIDIYSFNQAKGTMMLKGSSTNCTRSISLTVSDAKIEAEGLKKLFKSVS